MEELALSRRRERTTMRSRSHLPAALASHVSFERRPADPENPGGRYCRALMASVGSPAAAIRPRVQRLETSHYSLSFMLLRNHCTTLPSPAILSRSSFGFSLMPEP